jgi:hypothetical protein
VRATNGNGVFFASDCAVLAGNGACR